MYDNSFHYWEMVLRVAMKKSGMIFLEDADLMVRILLSSEGSLSSILLDALHRTCFLFTSGVASLSANVPAPTVGSANPQDR